MACVRWTLLSLFCLFLLIETLTEPEKKPMGPDRITPPGSLREVELSEPPKTTSGMAVQCIIMVFCLTISFIFSALNLGLMALDVEELQMLVDSGSPQEQRHARSILPLRRRGNYLLCAILLVLTLVNAVFTTLLDDLLTSVLGVICTTLTLVLLGEILPQSLGARYGLAIGANTVYLTRLALLLTFPVAYPLGRLLDWVLGEEMGTIKTRENLKALVMASTKQVSLQDTEVNIITGALEMNQKRVEDIMTWLPDCFMLEVGTVLDFAVLAEIVTSGYSRVPVYEGRRSHVVSILFCKDLALVDPDASLPLRTIIQFQPKYMYGVPEGTTVTELFNNFKSGIKGHMAFVSSKETGEVVGLVTLEDVIEEIIQEEINDETDRFVDNRTMNRFTNRLRKRNQKRLLIELMKHTEYYKGTVEVPPKLILVSYQYLSQNQEPFRPQHVSPIVLMRMLHLDIYRRVRVHSTEVLYEAGQRADHFVMVLQGSVTVHVGVEKIEFKGGAFDCFGTGALLAILNNIPTLDKGNKNSTNVKAKSPNDPNKNLDGVHRDDKAGAHMKVESPKHSTNKSPKNQDVKSSRASKIPEFYPDYSISARGEVIYIRIDQSLYKAVLHATIVERSNGREEMPPGTKYATLYEKDPSSTDLLWESRDLNLKSDKL